VTRPRATTGRGRPQRRGRWTAPEHVLDLGAGTGALTRLLRKAGHRVTSVDPDERMIAVLHGNDPDAVAIVGRAEAVPMPDSSVDAVLVSAAWHWFDQDRAPHEIARVLSAAGRLGTVGTLLDPQVPWVAALYDRLVVQAGRPRPWELPTAPTTGPFTPAERRQFEWSVDATAREIVELVATWSAVARADGDTRDELLRWTEGVVRDAIGDGPAPVPYRSYCARCDYLG
jgi:ubiquinone/menaquinone biosynthesis C-methylase UbiE